VKKVSSLKAIEKQIERLYKEAVSYKDYKKEHPGTKKKPNDPMFDEHVKKGKINVYDMGEGKRGRYTVEHIRDDNKGRKIKDYYHFDHEAGTSPKIQSSWDQNSYGGTSDHKTNYDGHIKNDGTEGKKLKHHEIPTHLKNHASKAISKYENWRHDAVQYGFEADSPNKSGFKPHHQENTRGDFKRWNE
jgi:hypothetical protein